MDMPTKEMLARGGRLQSAALDNVLTDAMQIDGKRAGIATIHLRQDIALLCQIQTSAHMQLVNISRGVWASAFMLAALILRELLRRVGN
jgi:hypothetical protein